MKFGVCASLDQSADVAAAGFDYLEPGVVGTLKPEESSADVPPVFGPNSQSPGAPIRAFNLFLPGGLKIVGPWVDADRIARYVHEAFTRAGAAGASLIVFGSAGARQIPEGFSRSDADRQLQEFLHLCTDAAQSSGVDLAIEALNTGECNFVGSVAEAAALARRCGSPRVGVVSDIYHILMDGQSYEETLEARDVLKHVHVCGGAGRRAPGEEDLDLLTEYFRVLKRSEYDALISIEASWESIAAQGASAHAVLTRAWADA